MTLPHEDQEVTSLKELMRMMEKLEKCDSKKKENLWKEMQSKNYRINVDIERTEMTLLKDIVKFFDVKSGKIYDFHQIEEAVQLNNPRVILFNVFIVSDESLDEYENLQLYLQTMDENPQCIFDLWQALPALNIDEFLQENKVKQAEEVLEESLLRLSYKKNFDLIVEFKKGQEDNVYLRVIDSMFWFV